MAYFTSEICNTINTNTMTLESYDNTDYTSLIESDISMMHNIINESCGAFDECSVLTEGMIGTILSKVKAVIKKIIAKIKQFFSKIIGYVSNMMRKMSSNNDDLKKMIKEMDDNPSTYQWRISKDPIEYTGYMYACSPYNIVEYGCMCMEDAINAFKGSVGQIDVYYNNYKDYYRKTGTDKAYYDWYLSGTSQAVPILKNMLDAYSMSNFNSADYDGRIFDPDYMSSIGSKDTHEQMKFLSTHSYYKSLIVGRFCTFLDSDPVDIGFTNDIDTDTEIPLSEWVHPYRLSAQELSSTNVGTLIRNAIRTKTPKTILLNGTFQSLFNADEYMDAPKKLKSTESNIVSRLNAISAQFDKLADKVQDEASLSVEGGKIADAFTNILVAGSEMCGILANDISDAATVLIQLQMESIQQRFDMIRTIYNKFKPNK